MVVNYDENNLLNLSNSILKYFDINPFNNTLVSLDKLLEEKQYKNVILFVCDGLGNYNLNRLLPTNSFLKQNKRMVLSSVFPPTTTAATTTLLSGLTPAIHHYLGWDMYFKDTNETISIFRNLTKDLGKQPKKSISDRNYMNYKSIVDLINETSKNSAYFAYPFSKCNKCMNIDEVIDRIKELTKIDSKKFIYAYIENPDKLMHEFGINSKVVKEEVESINKKLENLSKELKDTIMLLTADHGLIATKYIVLKHDLPKLYDMLERTTSIESRAVGLKLKKIVKKEDFLNLYNKELKHDFQLLTIDEVIENKLFGNEDNTYLRDAIGDYLLIATKNISINYDDNSPIFKANHAGFTNREMKVPLVIIECD
ncbi:MAG: alkaline phosphatase family protein [Bacilli bacterium]|nr:alkaline phosphatase family protein [Bacilli bacterium]